MSFPAEFQTASVQDSFTALPLPAISSRKEFTPSHPVLYIRQAQHMLREAAADGEMANPDSGIAFYSQTCLITSK